MRCKKANGERETRAAEPDPSTMLALSEGPLLAGRVKGSHRGRNSDRLGRCCVQ